MDLTTYLHKTIQIVLYKGFTYVGQVVAVDSNSIVIIDKNFSQICLKEDTIEFIKVISQ